MLFFLFIYMSLLLFQVDCIFIVYIIMCGYQFIA